MNEMTSMILLLVGCTILSGLLFNDFVNSVDAQKPQQLQKDKKVATHSILQEGQGDNFAQGMTKDINQANGCEKTTKCMNEATVCPSGAVCIIDPYSDSKTVVVVGGKTNNHK